MPRVAGALARPGFSSAAGRDRGVQSSSQSLIPLGCRSAAWLEVPLSFLRGVPRGVLPAEVFLM